MIGLYGAVLVVPAVDKEEGSAGGGAEAATGSAAFAEYPEGVGGSDGGVAGVA